MRREFKEKIEIVKSEISSFKNKEIFIERFLENARHIEVQIFVSADNEIFILGDRDCSIQRRHQKILEEAPSSLTSTLKEKMKKACQSLLEENPYLGAGTLEFLVEGEKFYFLEMNTRLQVEHTITEMIYGLDLVKAQIQTMMQEPCFFNTLKQKGHSIQCRLCAEDPETFLPSKGKLLKLNWPLGEGIRVDTGFSETDEISSDYDSLLAKIIVYASSRTRAIGKMKQALKKTLVFGVKTNSAFLQALLENPLFLEGDFQMKDIGNVKALKPSLPEDLLKSLRQKENILKTPSFNPWSHFKEEK